jgi:hypothetical protein
MPQVRQVFNKTMQPELFQDLEGENPRANRPRAPFFPGRFFRLKVAYEDLIFGGLSGALLLLACFCMGVERGKQLEGILSIPVPSRMAADTQRLPVVSMEEPAMVPSPPTAPATVHETPAVRAVTPAPVRQKAYAIQLASYVGASAAQREAKRLIGKGYDARVLKRGRYFELRASGYGSRKQAAGALVGLRKWYRDAFIKTVSSTAS